MANRERALRLMVAKLAEMRARDREAILAQLTQVQQDRVRKLLDEYNDTELSQPVQLDHDTLAQDLSPWLLDLVATPAAERTGSRLTAHTIHALQMCAATISPRGSLETGARPGLLGSLAGRVRAGWRRDAL